MNDTTKKWRACAKKLHRALVELNVLYRRETGAQGTPPAWLADPLGEYKKLAGQLEEPERSEMSARKALAAVLDVLFPGGDTERAVGADEIGEVCRILAPMLRRDAMTRLYDDALASLARDAARYGVARAAYSAAKDRGAYHRELDERQHNAELDLHFAATTFACASSLIEQGSK